MGLKTQWNVSLSPSGYPHTVLFPVCYPSFLAHPYHFFILTLVVFLACFLLDAFMPVLHGPVPCSLSTLPIFFISLGHYLLLQSHLRDHSFNRLVIFPSFHFILSYCSGLWIVMGLHEFSLTSCLSHFTTCICLEANLKPSNLTLFLTVHFHAVNGYAITHMCLPHVYASLLFCHCHAVASCSPTLALDCIGRFDTNMYTYVCRLIYKAQGINWHPQSNSLGVSPSSSRLNQAPHLH